MKKCFTLNFRSLMCVSVARKNNNSVDWILCIVSFSTSFCVCVRAFFAMNLRLCTIEMSTCIDILSNIFDNFLSVRVRVMSVCVTRVIGIDVQA